MLPFDLVEQNCRGLVLAAVHPVLCRRIKRIYIAGDIGHITLFTTGRTPSGEHDGGERSGSGGATDRNTHALGLSEVDG